MKKELTVLTSSLFLSLANPVPIEKSIRARQILSSAADTTRPFPGIQRSSPPPFRKVSTVNEEALKNCCEKLVKDRRRIYTLTARSYRMSMQLRGIYTREGMIFFRLALRNHSNLDYDTDSIRFIIWDSHLRKTGPTPVIRLAPAFVYGDTRLVPGKSKAETVIVVPRFTLPEGRFLVIEMLEKNGGRHLQLRTGNALLVNSRQI